MALEDYEQDMMRCNRCSYCKHVPHDAMKDARFLGICPSIENITSTAGLQAAV